MITLSMDLTWAMQLLVQHYQWGMQDDNTINGSHKGDVASRATLSMRHAI